MSAMIDQMGPFLARVGVYDLRRFGTRYALYNRAGETVGVYDTARAATDGAMALIIAARKAAR